VIIREAERLSELVKGEASLPKWVVLAGAGHAVLLTKPLLPKFGKTAWNPELPRAEVDLLATLQGLQVGRGQ